MKLTTKQIKQRHFDKVYTNAKIIDCACGCSEQLKNKDRYGRDKKFINGHNGRKYKDPTQYKREWNKRNKKQRTDYKRDERNRRKVKMIKLLGGKCVCCGLKYNGENGSIFHFHHKNPKNKKFGIASKLLDINIEKIIKEVKKCLLLCANCHAIKHSGKF